jgi:hypothetical protein
LIKNSPPFSASFSATVAMSIKIFKGQKNGMQAYRLQSNKII